MDDIQSKLVNCFQTMFPSLDKDSIPSASQDTVPEWDSVATITLLNMIEDEFQVTMDLEKIAEFTSFQAIRNHLEQA